MTRVRRANRRGTVLPLLALCLGGLFGFVALAVDLGVLAVSRTQCQNAADVGALVGARVLNNKPGVVDNDRAKAIDEARKVIIGDAARPAEKPGNAHLSAIFLGDQVTTVQAGMYIYDAAANPPEFRADFNATPAAGQSWTAMKVVISTNQPTYFMRVFGVNTMPTGATAVAVHRPRDVAFALDMTGSMGYSSQFNTAPVLTPTRSLNPDTLSPVFGHYASVQGNIVATANLAAVSTGEAFPRNNYTISTPTGPPIVRTFYFDKANIATPATPVTAVATKTGADGRLTADLLNAFHRWNPPATPGAGPYDPPTYDFAGYDPTHRGDEASPKGPVPAPDTFKSMTDGVVPYAGDRYRRADGSINKTDATWATGAATTRAAAHAAELLGYGVNTTSGAVLTEPGGGTIVSEATFRDPTWERFGYDLDVVKYRAWKTASNGGRPASPADYLGHPVGGNGKPANVLVPNADKFHGYSMGPGYWGKTFFVWPPDPRWGDTDGNGTPDPASPDTNRPTADPAPRDIAGRYICDWRRRFFLTASGGQFPTQGTTGVNQALLNGGAGGYTVAASNRFQINYPAVLKWIKSGPQVLPPNLRAGHVLYYSSIPDDVAAAGGSTDAARDQQFWKNYIDYVLGDNYTSTNNLYGTGDSWSAGAATSIYVGPLNPWRGPNAAWPSRRPYLRYNDSPNRPRLHFWFGPLSLMDFLTVSGNWLPGTTYEGQNWQLKAGMSSVLDDIQKNHPNDTVGLSFFATDFTDPRVPTGQNFVALKNALFYPLPLLPALDVPTLTVASVRAEYRPYNDNFSAKSRLDIPNAGGSTDPNTGLMMAFNLLSPSNALPAAYGTVRGRRGASKIVILETDGVPNVWRERTFTPAGYDSYYTIGASSGNVGNNNSTVLNNTYPIVQQIVKNISPTTSGDSGLGLPNAPAKVYAIGFGDLFDTVLAPGAGTPRSQAHVFLAKVSEYGGTGPAGATTLNPDQVITGPYSNRISTLRSCMERIFQSGVSVTLIE